MSNLKCPFCQQELEIDPCGEMGCPNDKCKESVFLIGTKDFWETFIRTRKILDKAKWWLNEIVENHRYTPISTAEMALEEITALEQKESAFVHNKIEFPEYNDNLLEEFDKQFFENGQDDDLTETAQEQKDVK